MLSKAQIEERNKLIGQHGYATRLKRAKQICKTFKFKVDYDNCTEQQKEYLKMLFVEAKWIYNYILSQSEKSETDTFEFDYKNLVQVIRKDKDKNDILTEIKYVKSSVKQELITQIINQIKSLAKLKKHGYKVGKLKFKSEFNSIKLKQYGITHSLRGNRFKIQGIDKPIKVFGLKQLTKYQDIEYTTANLLYDGFNYYIALTCYVNDSERSYKNSIVGIDMGVATAFTLSDGTKYKVSIGESDRLKNLQRRLEAKEKGSNNRYKLIRKIRKEYIRMTNKKEDVANKIVHVILRDNAIVVLQDEQIKEWKEDGKSGTKIQHSVLGRVKNKLRQSKQSRTLDHWFRTTQHCPICGNNTKIELKDRTFECPHCGLKEDRDIHAAKNMIYFYLNYINAPGTDVNMPVSNKKIISYKQYCKRILSAKPESTTSLQRCN